HSPAPGAPRGPAYIAPSRSVPVGVPAQQSGRAAAPAPAPAPHAPFGSSPGRPAPADPPTLDTENGPGPGRKGAPSGPNEALASTVLSEGGPQTTTERGSRDYLIGRTLNRRYVVGEKVGEGGFGAVLRGKQVATGREVALKILHPYN